jgi:C_GCAxxG_C_C family probable redox protein
MDADITGKRARQLFESGYYCAESILKAVAEAHGIESNIVPAIATGFCSGQARTCGQCGALSGAIMSVGMVIGRRSPEDTVDKTYEAVREVIAAFQGRYNSTGCEGLLGCDLGTQEGRDRFDSQNLREQCLNYTEEAAGIVIRVLMADS